MDPKREVMCVPVFTRVEDVFDIGSFSHGVAVSLADLRRNVDVDPRVDGVVFDPIPKSGFFFNMRRLEELERPD